MMVLAIASSQIWKTICKCLCLKVHSVKEQNLTIAIMCIRAVGFAMVMLLHSHNLLPTVISIISDPHVAGASLYNNSNDMPDGFCWLSD